ncbi:Protein of unknown function [Pyronema omphalodes CBS 100304]|uniref:Uncharacterized protein n=1 Tax=Pyronema omphalodes (strain CBS 100304) TaxID=1076935 RepID=U4LKI6_PYROM|nr:Protein of unknown function [Pyronema omphalodes CBS 100304]
MVHRSSQTKIFEGRIPSFGTKELP